MKEIEIAITGRTPLLCNRFTDEAQLAATSGSRSSIANDAKTPVEAAEASLYKDDADGGNSWAKHSSMLHRCRQVFEDRARQGYDTKNKFSACCRYD